MRGRVREGGGVGYSQSTGLFFLIQPLADRLFGVSLGVGRDPKVFMKPGDTVEVEIEGIGKLSNHLVAGD